MNSRCALFLLLYAFCAFDVNAQPLPKTLLWRISGKNDHQPSYLYGTMHLTDERLFDLGDSLYAAIRQSDGLALELDPNALANIAIEEAQKELSNEKNIRDMLSEKDYNTYGPLLEKKLGKPLSQITSQDILKEKKKWLHQAYRAGKMQTFLDVFILDIARRQQKWTGGIEDLVDQEGLITNVVDKSDILNLIADSNGGQHLPLQRMIETYLRQDLDAIDTAFDITEDMRVLIKRNHKMAQRMDSLCGVRSMVFAVGAAHLPGKEGLINLLRARGFKVEPVFSSRKIKSSEYPLPDIPVTWETVIDDDGSYRLEMPGKPSDLTLSGSLKAKAFVDIFNTTSYLTMSVHSSFSEDKADSLLDRMSDNLFHHRKKDFTPLSLNGAHGREYAVTDTDGYKKAYILERNGIFYLALGTASQPGVESKEMIDRFLHSFQVLDPRPATGGNLKGVRFIDSAQAYAVVVPVKPNPYPQKNDNWISRVYLGTDLGEGNYYFIASNSVQPGHYIENDSTLFENMKKEVVKGLKDLQYDTSWIDKGRLIMEYRGTLKDNDMTMTMRYIDRGNRWYSLLAMYPKTGPTAKVDNFFASFSELDYPAHSWQRATSGDSVFTAWSPGIFIGKQQDSSETYTYTSYDSSRATSYDIVKYKLGPYYWSISDSVFWAALINASYSQYRDSLIEKRPVRNGDAQGWEWIKRERTSHLYYRTRLLLHGDRLYALVVNSVKDQIHTPDNDRFFEDFRFRESAAANPYLRSKAESLLHDLFAPDSTTAEKAYSAISEAPFENKDLPILRQSLLKVSPLDRNSNYHRVSTALTAAIRQLSDTGTPEFVREHYLSVPDSLAFIRNALLTLLTIQDSTHFAALTDLLRKAPPVEPIHHSVTRALADTPLLTARFFPRLLPLLKDTLQISELLKVTAQQLDSGYLDLPRIALYRATLQAYGAKQATQEALSAENYDYRDKYLIRILRHYHDASAHALFRKFQGAKEGAIKLEAIRALLADHQPVSEAAILSLAANNDYRLGLFIALTDAKRMDLFPPIWRTQKAMGEAEVYAVATENDDDDDEPQEKPVVTFLKETVTSVGNTRQRFLFYKVHRKGEVHLACAGPYSINPGKLSTLDITAYIYEEPYSPSAAAGQIGELLKSYQSPTP